MNMRNTFVLEKQETREADALLVSTMILLVGLGLGMLFSASYHRGLTVFQDPYYFIRRQVLWVGLGGLAAVLVSKVPLDWIRRVTPHILLVSLFLMGLCLVPGVSPKLLGARRWIVLFGFSFQPSELAKLAMVLYLAFILEKKQERLNDPVNSILPPAVVILVFAALTYLQNDFSTAAFLFILGFLCFYVAGVPFRYLGVFLLTTAPLGFYLMFTKEHRVQRLLTFLNPGLDPRGAGFQVLAARNALLRGGFWGIGIGQGTRKLGGLPEAHSDFIAAVIGEELGWIGILLVIGLFLTFAARGYSIAYTMNSAYHRYLAFGLTSSILIQALTNLSVISGIIPATGIPLPFISSGGSSMLISLIMCGLLLNLSRQIQPGKGGVDG
ncbi:MAG: putative lipid II flippase FtsW [Spirochaetales bacterium]